MRRPLAPLVVAILGTAPALILRLGLGADVDYARRVIAWSGGSISGALAALIFGVAVLAAAFLISWAAELLQLDVSQNLAIALIALLAVLPEYSVDMYLAWTAATRPENASLALANMTGANRLLIGLGWPTVALTALWRWKRRVIELEESRSGEVFILGVATVYSALLPIKGTLTLFDTVIFLALFAFYIRYVTKQEVIEPELGGPAEVIARLPTRHRRLATAGLFALAGVTLLWSAEGFAEGLKLTGENLGVSEFLLIQWIAPLASEAPEFIIVVIFALRGHATAGFGALVSSKVNQWTLLVGMVPLVYGAGLMFHGQGFSPMPLDQRQFGELMLTTAQSYFAVVVVFDRRFRIQEALQLLVLFLAQFGLSVGIEEFVAPGLRERLMAGEKVVFTAIYAVLGTFWLIHHRRELPKLLRSVMRT